MIGTVQERFEAKVDRLPGYGPHGQCHLWKAHRNRDGYGRVRVGGKVLYAHRAAWELENGPVPEGLCVLHRCDTPRCVNVEHLFLGTQADNIADMETKGRGSHPKGSAITQSKLNEGIIPEIRKDLAEGVSGAELARRHGVDSNQISRIKLGKSWKHVQ